MFHSWIKPTRAGATIREMELMLWFHPKSAAVWCFPLALTSTLVPHTLEMLVPKLRGVRNKTTNGMDGDKARQNRVDAISNNEWRNNLDSSCLYLRGEKNEINHNHSYFNTNTSPSKPGIPLYYHCHVV